MTSFLIDNLTKSLIVREDVSILDREVFLDNLILKAFSMKQRELYWKRFIDISQPYEDEFTDRIVAMFEKQKKDVLVSFDTMVEVSITEKDFSGYYGTNQWAVSTTKGGPGSGNRGHAGRPGHVGGSGAGGEKDKGKEAFVKSIPIFHGTNAELVGKIKKEGLLDQGHYITAKVFATDELKIALAFGAVRDNKAELVDKDVAVFLVNSSRFMRNALGHYVSNSNIPPEDLLQVSFYRGKDVIAYVKGNIHEIPKPYKTVELNKVKKKSDIPKELFSVVIVDYSDTMDTKTVQQEVGKKSLVVKAGLSQEQREYFSQLYKDDQNRWDTEMQEMLAGMYEPVILGVGDTILSELGGGKGVFNVKAEGVQNFVKNWSYKLSFDINDETRNMLRDTVGRAMDEGWGLTKTRNEIRGLFDNMMGVGWDSTEEGKLYRAMRIARTETSRAANFATEEAFVQSDVVEGKEWCTALDERRCPFCGAMDGKVIGLGEVFEDDGKGTIYSVKKAPPLHPQ